MAIRETKLRVRRGEEVITLRVIDYGIGEVEVVRGEGDPTAYGWDVEVIARATRFWRSRGSGFTGWVVFTAGSHDYSDPIPNKIVAMRELFWVVEGRLGGTVITQRGGQQVTDVPDQEDNMTSEQQPDGLSGLQRYGLDQAAMYGNFGAVRTVTATSLFRRRLAVPLDPGRPRGHVQLTAEGWALLTDEQQQAALSAAYNAARREPRQGTGPSPLPSSNHRPKGDTVTTTLTWSIVREGRSVYRAAADNTYRYEISRSRVGGWVLEILHRDERYGRCTTHPTCDRAEQTAQAFADLGDDYQPGPGQRRDRYEEAWLRTRGARIIGRTPVTA